MLELLNAIYAKFTEDSVLQSAFPGGWHREQAPEATQMPYIVSEVLSVKVLYAYSGPYRMQSQMRHCAYGIGHDAVGNAMKTLIAQSDDALLTLTSGTNNSITRLTEATPKLHRHDANGNDVWEWSVMYQYDVLLTA